MRKSIYEEACEKMQPEVLKIKTKISFNQLERLIESFKEYYSKDYIEIYENLKIFIFGINRNEDIKTFEECVKYLKEKTLDEFELDSFCDAISEIYGVSYCEVRYLYEGKNYWMSISRLYQ